MKQSNHILNKIQRYNPNTKEKGFSIVIALMMGMVLMAGVTGLMLRQLMSRKLSAAESFQQMAETAAVNGFNRILGEINNNDSNQYKGYLLTLDHHAGDPEIPGSEVWGWKQVNQENFPLRELCTDRTNATKAVPSDGTMSGRPFVDITTSSMSQRVDGKDNIKLQYRLRGYYSPGAQGFGEGTFEIEGIAVREGDDPETNYLARTLLLRSLYINSTVAGEGDWAVLAGQDLSLGGTKIVNKSGGNGDGKILLNVSSAENYQTATGCLPSNLLDDIKADSSNDNLLNRVVPIHKQGLPSTVWWDLGLTIDSKADSNNARIWSFDDSGEMECGAFACQRETDEPTATGRNDLLEDNEGIIRLKSSELCQGKGNDCHIYVEHINLNQTRLLIETSKERPIVLHLESPGQSTTTPTESLLTGSINLSGNSQLCGVNSGQITCNEQPEQLVIVSAARKPSGVRSCSATSATDRYVLAFEGNSLPNATVHMLPGIVKTGSSATELNGLIWADGICTDAGPFALVTETKAGSTVMRDLNTQWGWSEKGFAGYGQMVVRGIRGTGLDTFRRW